MLVAVAADPLSQPSQEAKITVKTTPDTYSGVAVLLIDRMDRLRSVRVPSRMPAKTPMISALGTITAITQNIRIPVAPKAGKICVLTFSLNLVEHPKSPCSTPAKVGSAASAQKRKRGTGSPVSRSTPGCFGQTPSQAAYRSKKGSR